MDPCPCKGCDDRSITCHATCEKYIQWRHDKDIENQRIQQQRSVSRPRAVGYLVRYIRKKHNDPRY